MQDEISGQEGRGMNLNKTIDLLFVFPIGLLVVNLLLIFLGIADKYDLWDWIEFTTLISFASVFLAGILIIYHLIAKREIQAG